MPTIETLDEIALKARVALQIQTEEGAPVAHAEEEADVHHLFPDSSPRWVRPEDITSFAEFAKTLYR